MNEKVLVIFNKNWAEKLDLYGFTIMDSGDWEKAVQSFLNAKEVSTQNFGVNDDDEDSINDDRPGWLESYSVKKMTEEEYKIVLKLFPDCEKYDFGHFPYLETLIVK